MVPLIINILGVGAAIVVATMCAVAENWTAMVWALAAGIHATTLAVRDAREL